MCGGGRGKRARESWPHSHSWLVLGLCVILVLCCCPVGMDDSVSVAHMTMGPSLSARECRQQATLLTLLMCRWNTTHILIHTPNIPPSIPLHNIPPIPSLSPPPPPFTTPISESVPMVNSVQDLLPESAAVGSATAAVMLEE